MNFPAPITSQDKLLITKHLAVMLKSGIPLSEAFSILISQTSNSQLKKILTAVQKEIQNGQSLYKSFGAFPKIFDSFYLNLINIGEQSGTLEKNLEYLTLQLQKDYDFRKKVASALMYPIFVLVVAFMISTGISLFVLPQFVNLFESMDITLPLTTQILIFTGKLMQNYGLLIIPGIFLVLFLISLFLKTAPIKPHWHRFLLGFPFLGKFLQNVNCSSICRNFGLMLKSGLPITTAIEALVNGEKNLVYKKYLVSLKNSLDKGKNLEVEISSGNYRYFPVLMSKMIGVGEKTGKLDESLLYLGDFFENEVDSQAKDLPAILEPILLVIIAALVLFLALSIISPIYQFTGSIKR